MAVSVLFNEPFGRKLSRFIIYIIIEVEVQISQCALIFELAVSRCAFSPLIGTMRHTLGLQCKELTCPKTARKNRDILIY